MQYAQKLDFVFVDNPDLFAYNSIVAKNEAGNPASFIANLF